MNDQEIRAALDRHWTASDGDDFATEHDIYLEDAVLEYPSPESASAVGATSKSRVPSSRAKSASQCGESLAAVIFGSRSIF